jgi:hypothetical protein
MSIETCPEKRVGSGAHRGRDVRRMAGSKSVRMRRASILRTVKRSFLHVSKSVKTDIREAKKVRLPWQALLCLFVVAMFLRGRLKDSGLLYLYLPIFNGVGVFGFLFYLKWRLRRYVWFWLTMTAVLALHILLILVVPWTNDWIPALAIAGIDSLDLCLIFWILDVVEELVGSSKENAPGESQSF